MATDLGNAVLTIELDDKGFSSGLASAKGQAADFTGQLGLVGKALNLLLHPLTLTSAAVAAIGAAAVSASKQAIEFESAFAGIRKTVDGSEADFQLLESSIKGLSTTIPVAASELAKIGEVAGQLGVQKENIASFTRVIADLGVASNLSGEEGAQMIARFANITGVPQEQFSNIASAIIDLGNNSAASEAEIAAMALRLAGAGTSAGVSAGEILGFSAALSSVGINAEEGGTALSKFILDLQSQVALGKSELAGFAAIAGQTTEAFAKHFREDATGAIVAFSQGLGAFIKGGGDVAVVFEALDIQGVRLQSTLQRMALNSDGLSESIRRGTEAFNANTALQEEAAKRYATTESQLQLLSNQMNVLATEVGSGFSPAIVGASQQARSFADDLTQIVRAANATSAELSKTHGELQAGIVWLTSAALGWENIKKGVKELGDVAREVNMDALINAKLKTMAEAGESAGLSQMGLRQRAQEVVKQMQDQEKVMKIVNELLKKNSEGAEDAAEAAKAWAKAQHLVNVSLDKMRSVAETTPLDDYLKTVKDSETWTILAAEANRGFATSFEHLAAKAFPVTVTMAGVIDRLKEFGVVSKGSTADAVELLNRKLAALWEAVSEQRIPWEQARDEINKTNEEINKLGGRATETVEKVEKLSPVMTQVSTAVTTMAGKMVESLFQVRSFGDAWTALKDIGVEFAKTITQTVIEGALKPLVDHLTNILTPAIDSAIGALKSLFGFGGGSIAGTPQIPGVPSVPGVPTGTPASGGSGGGGGGLGGAIDMVTGIGTLVSSVIGNFQFAGMNKSLDLIVNHTLRIFNIQKQMLDDTSYRIAANSDYIVGNTDNIKTTLWEINGKLGAGISIASESVTQQAEETGQAVADKLHVNVANAQLADDASAMASRPEGQRPARGRSGRGSIPPDSNSVLDAFASSGPARDLSDAAANQEQATSEMLQGWEQIRAFSEQTIANQTHGAEVVSSTINRALSLVSSGISGLQISADGMLAALSAIAASEGSIDATVQLIETREAESLALQSSINDALMGPILASLQALAAKETVVNVEVINNVEAAPA